MFKSSHVRKYNLLHWRILLGFLTSDVHLNLYVIYKDKRHVNGHEAYWTKEVKGERRHSGSMKINT